MATEALTPEPSRSPQCPIRLERLLYRFDVGESCCCCFQLDNGIQVYQGIGITFSSLVLGLIIAGVSVGNPDDAPMGLVVLEAVPYALWAVFSLVGWRASFDRDPRKAVFYLWATFFDYLVTGALLVLRFLAGQKDELGLAVGFVILFLAQTYLLSAVATWTDRIVQEAAHAGTSYTAV